jgi:hypothetical protein
MNRRAFVTAIAFSMIGMTNPAHAVNLDPKGLGQVLLYPYYTVNKSQDTYFSVANNSYRGIVAKVRFLEGRRGRPVLDFNLYLSAHDSWAAVVSQTADNGGAMLKTTDHSCTTPAIPTSGIAFSAAGYDGSGALPADNGPHGITRTREGSIEVIAGGEIWEDSPTALAIMHTQTGQPGGMPAPGCATLPGSLVSDIFAPTNGLYGYGAIINVGQGTYYAYNADAIANFTAVPLFTASTGPLEPSLDQANSGDADGPGATAYLFSDFSSIPNGGRPQSAHYPYGIDAVTAVLTADTIQNDYLIAPGLGAATDWIVSLPTKRFYVDPIYPDYGVAYGGPLTGASVAAAVYDREEGAALAADQESFLLPYSVNVISFLVGAQAGAPSGVFGSLLNTNIAPTAESGTMRLDVGGHRNITGSGFYYPQMPFGDQSVIYGAPVVGFMAHNIVNANAQPGRLANYGATFPHRTTACTGTAMFQFICRR